MNVIDELLVTNADDFHQWLADPLTKPGDRVCYHVGHLASDKGTGSDNNKARIRNVARAALIAAGYVERRDGKRGETVLDWSRKRQLVRLFQRRFGDKFEYLAIRSSK